MVVVSMQEGHGGSMHGGGGADAVVATTGTRVHVGSLAHLLIALAAGVLVTGLAHVLHQRRLGSTTQASGDGGAAGAVGQI